MEAAQQEDLQFLGQLLQERLQLDIDRGDALKIGCAIRDGSLVVLSQHPPSVNLDPERTFAALKQALVLLRPQVSQPVTLYLRVAGQKQAYAKHNFTLAPPETATRESLPALSKMASMFESDEKVSEKGAAYRIPNTLARTHVLHGLPYPSMRNPEISQTKAFFHPRLARLAQIPTLALVVGGGVALASVFSSIYMLSHPCVIGECKPMQTAQQLSQAATHVTRWGESKEDLLIAQQELAEANNLLKMIPRWSSRYQEAQELSQTITSQSVMLDGAIAALDQAGAAAQKGKKPFKTNQDWQDIHALWQRAIAILEAVPSNSALSSLAQQKLSEYQASLKTVNQHFHTEQQATKKLVQAKNTAQIATKRQRTAQSLESWQKVKATWHTAVNTLAAIPKTSIAYQQAQQLLGTYRTELAAASDRASKEQMSAKAFSEAISLADLAQRDQQQHQLTKAVNHWKQALTSAKQIPSGTLYYKQAQPLIASYSSSFQEAQAQFRVANILQKTSTDLKRTCSSNIRICNYKVNNKLIVVQMTSDYEQAVERSYRSARLVGDSQTQANVAVHYRTLKQALEAISDNAGIPLQVHEARNSQIQTYKPK